ncbi:hypothetical protein [Geodermatophilus sp. SYSU D00079]
MHRRSRLLLVVPAATAMVFTGLSPALAGGGDHHDKNDVRIVEIERVEIENDDEARVYFTYECDEDTDNLSAKAHVRQDDARYASKDKEDVEDCEADEEQEDSVLVKRHHGDELDADEDAKVRVTLYEDDDEVDSETDRNVDVEDDDNGKGHH